MPKTKNLENKEAEEETLVKSEKEELKTSEKSSWIKTKPAELEKIVIDLAKQGNAPAKIGVILRDKHAIPKVKLLGKKITKILIDNNVSYIKDKDITAKKIENLKAHLEKQKHDYCAKKSLAKNLWLLHSLNKYQQ